MRRTVFIDALGTMLRLHPPWERIDPRIVEGLAPERVREGFLAEMAYYRDHFDEGADPPSLAELRRRCAAVLSRALGREVAVGPMMAAIRFDPWPDAAPALRELRDRGLRLICVSNWDCSLPQVLDRVGLGQLLDGVVTSATAGARKPDPAIFVPALALAACTPSEAVHVGDSEDDVTAARAAGIAALRIDRSRAGAGDLASLTELADRLSAA